MQHAVWTQPYLVTSYLANPQKKLGLYAALNLLQDTAWMHATHLGHGYQSTLEQNVIWVLTRQELEMASWPGWGRTVEVRTWIRPPQGPFAIRDFELLVDDEVVGTATTSWLMMDVETRRATRKSLADLGVEARSDYRLPLETSKIAVRDDLVEKARFQVRNSDLDMHRHVNNTRYAQWILDAMPLEWHQRFRLQAYGINFLAEAHAGDRIAILMSPVEAPGADPVEVQFQGLREADGKTVFAARLRARAEGEA